MTRGDRFGIIDERSGSGGFWERKDSSLKTEQRREETRKEETTKVILREEDKRLRRTKNRAKIKRKSLILAQDERWRRA